MSDNDLGLFLRSRRESVPPARVGLPAGPRRRTPGLRRAELATLAGVSVEYITRLEQGRDRRPSPSVLSALADAMCLAPSERVHLHRLSKAADPSFTCLGNTPPNRTVRPTVAAILAHLEPAAAVVVNRLGDVLAHTDGYLRLMAPTGLFDDPHSVNVPFYTFSDARARTVFPDWSRAADEVVAALKLGPFRADPDIAALVDQLTVVAGAEFTERLDTVPNLPSTSGVTRMVHPVAGALRLAFETLELSADDDQRLIVHLPADASTAAALDTLGGRRPGALRAVGD